MEWRKLMPLNVSSSGGDITGGHVFESTESATFMFGVFGDWRDSGTIWHGPMGPMHVGTWGNPAHGVLFAVGSGAAPCPVCRLLGGFHDDDVHDARRRVPAELLLPSRVSKQAARVRLSDEDIAERRQAARLRREGTQHGRHDPTVQG